MKQSVELKDYTIAELVWEIERRIQEKEFQIYKLSKCKTEQEIKDCMNEYFRK